MAGTSVNPLPFMFPRCPMSRSRRDFLLGSAGLGSVLLSGIAAEKAQACFFSCGKSSRETAYRQTALFRRPSIAALISVTSPPSGKEIGREFTAYGTFENCEVTLDPSANPISVVLKKDGNTKATGT